MKRWFVGLGLWTGCQEAASDAGPAASDSDSGGPPLGPVTARCEDPGPDAPVVPRVLPEVSSFEGAGLQVYLPEDLRAVVIYFYGGDDLNEWNGDEQTAFANQMVDAGIGWITYSKANTGRGESWNNDDPDFSTNADLGRLERLWAELVATTPLAADTPIVSVGFSDGAAFSVFFAAETQRQLGWPISSVLVHNSSAGGVALPDAPMWVTASDFDDPGVLSGAERLAEEQAERGFPSAFRRVSERPITPEVFLRHAEWDLTKASEMHADMVGFGLVDAAGTRLVAPSDIERALGAWSDQSLERAVEVATARTRVVWATHRYSAMYTQEECVFVLGALGL